MATKYFYTPNANRSIRGKGFSFVFEAVNLIGGVWSGVFATDDPKQLAALEALTKDPKAAVKEITAEEFREQMDSKKKAGPTQPSTASAPPPLAAQITPRPARLVEDPEPVPAPAPDKPKVSSVFDVLKVGVVKPPETKKTPPAKPAPRKPAPLPPKPVAKKKWWRK